MQQNIFEVKKNRTQIWRIKFVLAVYCVIALLGLVHNNASASNIAVSSASTALVVNTGEYVYFDNATYGANVVIDDATRLMNGYAWSTDMGWLYFGSGADNPAGAVKISGGKLSGKAKFLNGGYVDFNASPTGASLTVQTGTGVISGYAWSEDLGWINFNNVTAPGLNYDTLAPDNPASVTATSNPGNNPISNNGNFNYSAINFSWSVPTDYANIVAPSGVAGYYVYFGMNNTASPLTLGTYTTSTTVTLPVPNLYSSTQYFRIQTIDNAGNTANSATLFTYNFYNDSITLVTPSAGQTGVSVLPEFRLTSNNTTQQWRYRIQLCSTSNCSSVVSTIDQTASGSGWSMQEQLPNGTTVAIYQYGPTPLTANTQYWWRVANIDPPPGANIWSGYSAISTFTTIASPSASGGLIINGGATITGGVNLRP